MNEKLIQLIERLWDIEPSIVTKNSICWHYKDCNIELAKYDTFHNEIFRVYILKNNKNVLSINVDVPEAKYLMWKVNLIKAYDKYSNTLLDTLLEEDDASCFDDLLDNNKSE